MLMHNLSTSQMLQSVTGSLSDSWASCLDMWADR